MEFRKALSGSSWEKVKNRQLLRFPLVHEWIEAAGIENGDTVLDIGPGPGVFTVHYAKVVGEQGKIIAIEKSEDAAAYLIAELQNQSIHHVDVRIGDAEQRVHVDNDDIDVVMLTDVLHHAEHPFQILKNLRNITHAKPIKLFISEFDPEAEGRIGPPLVHRIHAETIQTWATELNFGMLAHGKQYSEHYYMLLSIPAAQLREQAKDF
ncbi:class I SAM-dependent methyltransferase [Paenibacillus antri]|uniref:Class I SAM-dependent methyltransferase n=1 Tax=Paenibacillus antri TaxID=2582848 RepID=A0A5R9G8V4_9BACL|nr:class I SAM-dependent methyltransferase [Paenibacillus antri]TLS52161.1 class I SAM-dependent methyltransferase [Paenibacillus antri]